MNPLVLFGTFQKSENCHSQPGSRTCCAIYPHTNLLCTWGPNTFFSSYCNTPRNPLISLPRFFQLLASDMNLLCMLKTPGLFTICQCTCPCTYSNCDQAVILPAGSCWQHGSTPQWNYFQEQKLCIFQRTQLSQ